RTQTGSVPMLKVCAYVNSPEELEKADSADLITVSAETYRQLEDTVDRSISALYRGGDLATMSGAPDAAGVNAQAGESELMDDDGCKMVAETLRDQVEKFVIRFECGDFEPLAEIVINPPADADGTERNMAIDTHLAALGVTLSKRDALRRYGRTEAEDENDELRVTNDASLPPNSSLVIRHCRTRFSPRPPCKRLQTPCKTLRALRTGKGRVGRPPRS
ncbi:MAG: hypothetical protein J6Z49_12035, partial [Kiritimatiellae bacterium]|nr:hypothetical protein [Kiritimatiellia bacterium]